MSGDCCFIKFLQRSEDGKHLMRFQSETSLFQFRLWRSVTGPKASVTTDVFVMKLLELACLFIDTIIVQVLANEDTLLRT